MGEVAPIGSIKFKEEEIAGKKAFEIAKLGLGYVPENRDVFPGLTTKQNLQLGIKPGQDVDNSRWSLEDMYNLFENLKNRSDVEASFLSGGEQQMLALARALCIEPTLLLLDEPTEGLQPSMISLIRNSILELKKQGVAILLVEQRVEAILSIADEILVIENGSIVYTAEANEVVKDHKKLYSFLGV